MGMIFWLITGGMALAIAMVLSIAVLRGRAAATPAAAYDLRVYRDQLADIDRDVARGVLSESEAERVRTEVSRRILSADAALRATVTSAQARPFLGWGLSALMGAALLVGSFLLYLELGAPGYGDLGLSRRIEQAEIARAERPAQSAAEASISNRFAPVEEVSPQYLDLVAQLRATVAERPTDLQGHILLTQSEARLGNFAAAHAAQARVIALKGDQVESVDIADYADLLVLAAGGYVSPEAERVLERLLSMDPQNGTGLYYYGLMFAQTGRPDRAFRIWDRLLRQGPAEAPWIPPIVEQIDDLAAMAGVANYQQPEPGGSRRGPSAADVEAAGQMSAQERMDMIAGMVAGLSDRLATEGGPPEDWAQLITALGVLGRIDEARAIYVNALEVFSDAPAALDIVRGAADRAGLE